MTTSRSNKGFTDPVWRGVKITMLLWGVGQLTWLYLQKNGYSMFTTFLYLFLLFAGFAIRLQLGKGGDESRDQIR